MKYSLRTFVAIVFALLSLGVNAQSSNQSAAQEAPEIPWTYGEFQYSFISGGAEPSGWGFGGSMGFAEYRIRVDAFDPSSGCLAGEVELLDFGPQDGGVWSVLDGAFVAGGLEICG